MKSKAMRRWGVVIASVTMSALALSGCMYVAIGEADGTTGGPSGVIPTKAPVTTGVADELLPYYGQELVWEQCDENPGMDCTMVTVPMNYADTSAGDIELAVVRLRATDEAQGSLLMNPGGPGGSGYDYVMQAGTYMFSEDLQEEFDIIGFDPRGVGSSTAVVCFDAAQMDSYLYDIPKNPRGSDEWIAEVDGRAAEFAQACSDNTGALLEHITTENSARDMDVLRGVLGDEKLNYIGFSYGTFLGATYAKLFPERAGRLVLDGAIDPAIPSADVGKIQAVGFENALRAFMEGCLASSDCPYSGDVDEALADLSELLAELDARPIEVTDGRMLGADSAFTGVVSAMYQEGAWPILTAGLAEAEEGDGDTLMYLADSYNGREAGGVFSDNSTEAFNAYNCMDYPADMTDAEIDEVDQFVQDNAPTIAPYWSGGDTCGAWAFPPSGTRGAIAAEGAAPILVVGTTNDPATPYEWAVSLADQLSSGVLLTRVGEGHTAYGQGNACIDDAIDTFLLEGTPPADQTTCN
ncbi:alpha/beta hydrolase [Microbacterium mitrae]|nr:alpha/beta hydrolase [Microbacterium mitrae]